jgi:hypothetical protein
MTVNNDKIEHNPLVQADVLSTIWAQEAKDYMSDDEFSRTIDYVVKIIAEGGNVPKDKVGIACVKLEAYAIKFRMMYVGYMSYKKGTTEANMKKNHYKELYTGIDRLVDSLKYLVK